jgi:ribosomal protein S11
VAAGFLFVLKVLHINTTANNTIISKVDNKVVKNPGR